MCVLFTIFFFYFSCHVLNPNQRYVENYGYIKQKKKSILTKFILVDLI
jgi:hypothetical protein